MPDHLAARFRRHELNANAERAVAKAVLESGAEAPPHPNRSQPGDPYLLRGIPMVGVHGGLGGAIKDSRPGGNLV